MTDLRDHTMTDPRDECRRFAVEESLGQMAACVDMIVSSSTNKKQQLHILRMSGQLLNHCASKNGANDLRHGLHASTRDLYDIDEAGPSDQDFRRAYHELTVKVATLQQEHLLLEQVLRQEKDSFQALLAHNKNLQAEIEALRSSEENKGTSAEIPAAAHPGGLVDGRKLTILRNNLDNMRVNLRSQLDDMGTGTVAMTKTLEKNSCACATAATEFNKTAVHKMVVASLMCNEFIFFSRGFVDAVGRRLRQLTSEVLGRDAKQAKSFITPIPQFACCVFCSNHFSGGDVQIPLLGDPQTAFLTCRDCLANTLESDSSTKALGILRQSFPDTCKPNLDLVPEPYHGCSFEDQVRWDLIIVAAGAEEWKQKVFVQHHTWLWSWWNAQLGEETAEDEGRQEPPSSPAPEPPDGQLDVRDSDQGSDGGARSKSPSPFGGMLPSAQDQEEQGDQNAGMSVAFEKFAPL